MQHKKINFVIYSGDYSDKIGGIISCNMLAEILYIFSQNVFLYRGKPYPNSPITFIPEYENIWNFLEKEKTVVVYPETVNDNPLNSLYIARWLLNTPGIFSKSKTYEPFGEHFIFSNQFESVKGKKDLPILFAINPKLSIFKDKKMNKRSGTYYMIRKGIDKFKKYKIDKSWKEMPTFNEHLHDIEILNFFNKIEKFISFDDASYYSQIASLCGAQSIVIPKKNISKEKWINSEPLFKYGIAYGFEDIEHAEKTSRLLRNQLEKLTVYSYKTVLDFINFWYSKIFEMPNYKLEESDQFINILFNGIRKAHSPDLINFLSRGLEVDSFLNIEGELKKYKLEIETNKIYKSLYISQSRDPLFLHISFINLLNIVFKRIIFHFKNRIKKIWQK